ncbi:MAG: LamG domain-containing protein [Verrucomicrobiota bacterium]|nr:LamG domain-containing protein [Verrucomicrobiota bacterium]
MIALDGTGFPESQAFIWTQYPEWRPSPWVPGRNGLALEFTGSTSAYAQLFRNRGITGRNPRTVAAWIKTDTTGAILAWGDGAATGRKWTFRVQDNNGVAGALRVEVQNGYVVGTTPLTDGEWHHVAATWEDDGTPQVTDVKLYVDGAAEAFSASRVAPMNTAGTNDVVIGRDYDNRGFNGLTDEVRIYDRALSCAEIAELAE